MSGDVPANSNVRRRAFRLLIWGVVLALLLVFTGNGHLLTPWADIAVALCAGWAFFLQRAAPSLAGNTSGLVLAVVCGALLVGLLQVALRRWSTTLCVAGVVVLAFVSSYSMLGIVRHGAWLLSTTEPRFRSEGLRRLTERMQATNNLKQLGLAYEHYESQTTSFPPAGTFDAEGRGLHGWLTFLLPHLEQHAVYDLVRFDRPWKNQDNEPAFRQDVPPFHTRLQPARSHEGYGLAFYALNAHLAQPGRPLDRAGITDGAANTILTGEVVDRVPEWGQPANWRDPGLGINQSPAGFGGPNHGLATFAMADGSVRTISSAVDPAVLRALSTPNAGDDVNVDRVPANSGASMVVRP